MSRFREGDTSDSQRWHALAGIGLFGISVPEDDGGLGLDWADEALAAREAGRHLVSPALIGTAVAARMAAAEGLTELGNALLAGEHCVGIALPRPAEENLQVIAGSGVVLTTNNDGLALLDITDSEAAATDCLDDTLPLATLTGEPATLATATDPSLALGARLLAAAMLCGQLEYTRDMAADHARNRVQFGRPIGAFQGIKHRCADIALAAELCWAQTLQAAQALSDNDSDAPFHVASALYLAGNEALNAARFNIQAHGAMGFTDEVDAHRLLKRAHVLRQLFDDPRSVAVSLVDLPLEL